MSKPKIESLVPPRDLCRQIPPEAFDDSALIWMFDGFDWWVNVREFDATYDEAFPAPTLAEIFAQLPQTSTVTWFTQEEYPNNFAVCCYVLQPKPRKPKLKSEIDDNPAAAALKLWLELNKK